VKFDTIRSGLVTGLCEVGLYHQLSFDSKIYGSKGDVLYQMYNAYW
jgi:hypothetical protein